MGNRKAKFFLVLLTLGACCVAAFAVINPNMQIHVSPEMSSVLFILSLALVISVIAFGISRSLRAASESDPSSLQTIAKCADHFEATAVITRLADHKIHAKAVGGFTSGFQAESPGDVHVVVRKMDWERAAQVLSELQAANLESPDLGVQFND